MNDQERTARQKLAADSMDSSQATLDELSRLKRDDLATVLAQQLEWQQWLAAVSFGLSGIGGVVFITNPNPPIYLTISVALLLAAGILVALRHKVYIERNASNAPLGYDEVMPLYLNKKKAGFVFWQDGSDESYALLLEADRAIQRQALASLNLLRKELRTSSKHILKGIDYTSDILVLLVVTAIFTLVYPLLRSAFNGLSLPLGYDQSRAFLLLYGCTYLAFFLFWARTLWRSRADALKSHASKDKYYRNQAISSRDYIKKIEQTISEVRG